METSGKNLKAVKISFFDNESCILSAEQGTGICSKLYCNMRRKRIQELDWEIHNKENSTFYFSLFIGVVNVSEQNFFLFAEKVKKVGIIKKHNVYEVKTVRYLPLSEKIVNSEIKESLFLITNQFTKGYYFSFTLDLSTPLDKAQISKNYFYINETLQNFLFLDKKLKGWKIPIVQGYFSTKILKIKANIIRLSLFAKIAIDTQFIEINQIIETESSLVISKIFAMNFHTQQLDTHIKQITD